MGHTRQTTRRTRGYGAVSFKDKEIFVYSENETSWDYGLYSSTQFLNNKGKQLFEKFPEIEISNYTWVNIDFDKEKRMFYAQMVLDDVVQDTKYYLGRKVKIIENIQ